MAELAATLSAHPNTVRFHLNALERAGEVERTHSEAAGRGRPAVRFRISPSAGDGERRYDLLAGILASGLDNTGQERARAVEAGFAWGAARARRTPVHGQDTVGELVGLLDEVGFEPQRADAETVELRNCPFQGTVEGHQELICGIHAGLMRGALSEWDSRVEMVELQPFAAPGVCRARLRAVSAA